MLPLWTEKGQLLTELPLFFLAATAGVASSQLQVIAPAQVNGRRHNSFQKSKNSE